MGDALLIRASHRLPQPVVKGLKWVQTGARCIQVWQGRGSPGSAEAGVNSPVIE